MTPSVVKMTPTKSLLTPTKTHLTSTVNNRTLPVIQMTSTVTQMTSTVVVIARAANYSCLIITGNTNCVFTGIPLLIAGLICGKSTKRALRILSILIVS